MWIIVPSLQCRPGILRSEGARWTVWVSRRRVTAVRWVTLLELAPALNLELRPHHRVIRSPGRFPRLQVDVRTAACRRQRPSSQYVIDAPSPVMVERIAEVIPVRILHAVRVQLPEYIYKAPRNSVPVSFAGVDMEIRVVNAPVRMVDIYRLGRDIQVARPDRRLGGIQSFAEITTHAVKPLQFKHIPVGAHLVSLWNVSIDDRYAFHHGLQDAHILAVRAFA